MKVWRIFERWEVRMEADTEAEALEKYHAGEGDVLDFEGRPYEAEYVEFLSIEEEGPEDR